MRLQDAYTCAALIHPRNPIVAVVSDGAGTAQFGGQGAVLTCRALSLRARLHFSQEVDLPSDNEVWSWVDGARDWIGLVAARRGVTLRDFAATLVCMISDGHESIIAHIGDGCAVVKNVADGQWIAPSWPDYGEYASMTYFITDEEGPKLRISRHIGDIRAFAVFSDGIERLALDLSSKQAFSPFLDPVIAPVFASTATNRDRALSLTLKGYLNSDAINARTDDDKTLLLAVSR